HHNAVVHTDRVELERYAAGLAHRLLDDPTELLQVDVAGDDVDVGVADRDERLVEVGLVADLAGGAQQAAVRRAVESTLDRVGTHSKILLSGALLSAPGKGNRAYAIHPYRYQLLG